MNTMKKFLFLAEGDQGDGKGNEGKPVLDDKGVFTGSGDDKGKKAPAADEGKTEKVKVRVGNDELETDAASAAAINALLQNNNQLYDYIKNMTGKPAPKDEGKKPGYDYATGLFTEPEEALKRLREEIKAEVKGEITTAYNAAETQKDFWQGFYKDNSDLSDEKMMVNAVMTRDWAILKDLAPAAAAKKLAEATKKELMRISGGKSPSDDNARQIEGGSTKNSAPAGKKSDDDKVLSLSDIIKKRQEARRKAQFSKE